MQISHDCSTLLTGAEAFQTSDFRIDVLCFLQGWRLDPLLLFCQLLTAGTALGFAIESLRLRQEVRDIQVGSECALSNK